MTERKTLWDRISGDPITISIPKISGGLFRSRKEPMSNEDFARALGSDASWTGKDVNRTSAMGISATWSAVRLLSDSVASLPLVFYRRTDRGKEKVPNDPLFTLLSRQPNKEETSYTFRETLQHHLLLRGNAYAKKVFYGGGRVGELWPLDVEHMRVERSKNSGDLFYAYHDGGRDIILTCDEVLHIPGLGWDGITGYAPLEIAMQEFGYSIAVKEYGSEFFKNDGTPNGYLQLKGRLKDEDAVKRLKRSWGDSHSKWGKKNSVGVLEDEAEFKQTTIPPEHMQFIESKNLSVTDIARVFRVPPHMIGDLSHATFSNIEQQSLDFVINSLRPWLVRWEQNLNNQIIPSHMQAEYFYEFNVNALLRGDFDTRSKGYRTFIEMGAMTPNEVRALENFNTVEGLDEFYVPLNWQKVDDEELDKSTEPGAGGIVDDEIIDDVVKQTALNGAQIKSLLEIIQSIAVGNLAVDTGKALIKAGFPGLPQSLVDKMISSIKKIDVVAEPDETKTRMIDGVETRQTRAAKSRFKLSNRFRPLFEDVIGKIIRKEARDIRTGVNKYLDTRGLGDFNLFLKEFYKELPGYIRKQMTPTYRTFAESVKGEVAQELGGDGEFSVDDESFVGVCYRFFIGRYIGKSRKDLTTAITKAVDSGIEEAVEIEKELTHWEDKRADFTAHDEVVRSGNAFAKTFMIAAGVTLLRWVSVGESCPYCDTLDGKVVGVDQQFALPNDVIEANGGALGVSSSIGHPPIHRGCDCQIVAG